MRKVMTGCRNMHALGCGRGCWSWCDFENALVVCCGVCPHCQCHVHTHVHWVIQSEAHCAWSGEWLQLLWQKSIVQVYIASTVYTGFITLTSNLQIAIMVRSEVYSLSGQLVGLGKWKWPLLLGILGGVWYQIINWPGRFLRSTYHISLHLFMERWVSTCIN